jgi:hypothetical protein
MNGTGIRFSSWAVAGFDALRNARDRQISTNAREQSGHTNGDGPRGGVGGGGGNTSGGCSSLRIALWDALIFYNNFHMAKLCFGLCENSFSFMSSAAGVCSCNLSVLG